VPTRLIVPALQVDAVVVPVVTGSDGVLWPPYPTKVGWWRTGAKPGAAWGSAVLVGHRVHTGGGVFDHLPALHKGDDIRVRTRNGVIGYHVTSRRIYSTAAFTSHASQIFTQDVPGRLVLISCTDWNGKTYDSSAVVTAKPL
jgi:LPXTG-site transpeptidase (sortase) family protein